MLFILTGSLVVTLGTYYFWKRFRQATSFLAKCRRAFRFCVLDNSVLDNHTKTGFMTLYKKSEPPLLKLLFSVKAFTEEHWYTPMERDLYFKRYTL